MSGVAGELPHHVDRQLARPVRDARPAQVVDRELALTRLTAERPEPPQHVVDEGPAPPATAVDALAVVRPPSRVHEHVSGLLLGASRSIATPPKMSSEGVKISVTS